MSKKNNKTDDTKDVSAMTTEVNQPTSDVVDKSKVSNEKKLKYEKPKMVELNSLEEFDPSATHEDFSEDDKFDDDEDID